MIDEETEDEKKARDRRAMLASRLARDPALKRACHLYAQAVYARAISPEVAKLACGLLLDIELHDRESP